jgi:hypothetical protein
MCGEWTETDRLPYLIVKYRICGQRSQGRALKRLLELLMGLARGTWHKICKLYDDDDGGDDEV